MTLYHIEFEVDDGAYYRKDNALVMARDSDEAIEKLKRMINSIDSETCVSEIYNVTIFGGEVFTGNHGWG